jgi:tetraacyldisaccharide 4'-kinase
LQRCDGIILIGNKPISSQINLSSASVFRAAIKPRQSTPQDVIAFAGLGTPEKFKKTLEKEGYIVREFYAFSDHYSYAPQDIEKLLQRSYELKIPLLTTEKDFVRLPKDYQNHVQIFPIDLVFEDEEKITRLLQDLGK